MQHRHGLREVDDVDVVAGTEDERSHLRVPAVGLMAEMDASLQQLAHRIVGKRHNVLRFEPPRTRKLLPDLPSAGTTGWPKASVRVWDGALITGALSPCKPKLEGAKRRNRAGVVGT